MSFANPNILWLLLVMPPAMVAFFWWAARERERLMTRFIQARLLPALVSGISVPRRRLRLACLVGAVAALILALARPQWGFNWQEVKQRGVDIVVAIDTSKSMLAADITPNRLARAKMAALDLMKLARNDRLGLVAFAGNAFLECPLTIDDVAFRQAVDALDVNTLPQGGTAIAEAINTALTAFKEGDNHKILVLMTDGEDHDSGAMEAAQRAAQAGLVIYSIGIGTPEGEMVRYRDADGKTDYVRDEQGNVVKSHLEERLLQEIAGKTEGGFYLHLAGAKTMDALYSDGLAKLPKSEHQEKMVKQYQERYHWPLGAAILLLLAEMLLPERARPSRSRGPSAAISGTAAALLLLIAGPACGSPSSALREYKSGNYEQSLKEYQELLKRKGDDPRLHFNAGAAAYRDGKFDEAAKQFNEALSTPDVKLQELAYYNRGNAMYYLGERDADPRKRMENWQKALKDYEATSKLNSQDTDARFNHELVEKKLEELKKQQQQQQQQNQNNKQDKNQDQQGKQDQQQQQQKQDQQKDPSQQNQQPEQKQNQSPEKQNSPQPGQQQEQKQNDQQPAQSQAQKDQQQQQAQAGQSAEKTDDKQQQGEQMAAAGQMTPDQARQLLDAQTGDERMLNLKPEAKPRDPSRPFRDW